MTSAVSAADANRYFSKLLREVKAGRSCVITSHGRAVAKLVPIEPADRSRAAGKVTLLARLRSQKASGRATTWTRDELYEDE
jgi:prevent-host-death family protein